MRGRKKALPPLKIGKALWPLPEPAFRPTSLQPSGWNNSTIMRLGSAPVLRGGTYGLPDII